MTIWSPPILTAANDIELRMRRSRVLRPPSNSFAPQLRMRLIRGRRTTSSGFVISGYKLYGGDSTNSSNRTRTSTPRSLGDKLMEDAGPIGYQLPHELVSVREQVRRIILDEVT